MIVVKLQGGIGNQLFQYALGKTIEKKYAKDVAYDITAFDNQKKLTYRPYLLDKYNLPVKIATSKEVQRTKYPYGLFSKISFIIKKILNKFIFKKYNISYGPNFLDSIKDKDSIYLEGYWQSLHYVELCLDDMREGISLRDERSVFKEIKQEVSQTESVAIHIRRGDYVTSGRDLQPLEISYYEQAKNLVSEKIKNARYYVFTDDVLWVKKNFGFLRKEETVYVSDKELKDYEELVLIAKCKHTIIANSSFSWWGAVLNNNKDAIIVCPKDWRNVFLKNDENLCPISWTRV